MTAPYGRPSKLPARSHMPAWLAGDSTITALIPYRQGLLPSVRVFIDHLATEFPKAVVM
jgi:hypothetical protein